MLPVLYLDKSGFTVWIPEICTLWRKAEKTPGKHAGIIAFGSNLTGLKTDPGAFRFCQIMQILSVFRNAHDSAYNRLKKRRRGCRHRQTPPSNLPRRLKISVEKQPPSRHQRQIILPHASGPGCAIVSVAPECSRPAPTSVFPLPPPAGTSPDRRSNPLH